MQMEMLFKINLTLSVADVTDGPTWTSGFYARNYFTIKKHETIILCLYRVVGR